MNTAELISIPTGNGHVLRARFHHPSGAPKGKVLIVPAMGTGQSYYARFAAWLASRGYLAATFDYSGIGLSRQGSLRGMNVDILDWARHDCTAVLDALATSGAPAPIYWLGHSLGGQLLGLSPGSVRIRKAITIGSGGGYWLESPMRLKLTSWWLWFFVAPMATAVYGYFPGKRLRKVGDLPRGVMDQWRRWCTHKDYAVGREGDAIRAQFAQVTAPLTSLSFSDDEMVSPRNEQTLLDMYVNCEKRLIRIAPGDLAVTRIGHFGFFRDRFRTTLWEQRLLPELT